MAHPALAKHENLAKTPCRKFKLKNIIKHILHLPGGQWCIIYSRRDGSFRVWDLEKGTQVGEEWEVKDNEVEAMALSPDSKTVATGGWDGAVKLWDTNKGRVIKTLTGHTREAKSVCWSSNGRRVVSGSWDGTFRVWDIESGETILGPIEGGGYIWAVCYSPDGKTIATAGDWLKIWDANSGKLLEIIFRVGGVWDLAWTSDGKTLLAE